MEFYPEAKIILTIRDPETWYKSVKETIYQSNVDANIFPVNLLYKIFGMNKFSDMVQIIMRRNKNRFNDGKVEIGAIFYSILKSFTSRAKSLLELWFTIFLRD